MQFISDIHLEYCKTIPYIPILSNNLCLIGDIGHPGSNIYNDFIKQCSLRYTNVFIVYGNHEYFSILKGSKKTIETFEERLSYSKFLPDNVYLLNNSCIYLNTINNKVEFVYDENMIESYVKIIGSTLWSDNDLKSSNFKNIYIDSTNKLTYEEQTKLYNISKNYIIKEINKDINIKCILLTHYGTHRLCTENSIENKDTNHINEIFECCNLIGCINGHTHRNINTIAPGTNIKLISNCYGCKTEDQIRVKYNPNLTFNLNTENNKNTENISFYGLYSNSNVSDFDIINAINNRQNKAFELGPIDSSTSYLVTSSNKDNSIIFANRAFEELSGYSLSEIKGRNCRFMQSKDGIVKKNSQRVNVDNNLLYELRNSVLNEQECRFVLVNFKKCGTKFYNLVTIIPIVYKNEKYFVGLQKDISHIQNFNLFNKNIIDYNILNNNTELDSAINLEVPLPKIVDVNIDVIIPKEKDTYMCIFNKLGIIKKISDSLYKKLGYNKEEMINTSVLNYLSSIQINNKNIIQDIQIEKNIKFSKIYMTKDKKDISFDWNIYLDDDTIYGFGRLS